MSDVDQCCEENEVRVIRETEFMAESMIWMKCESSFNELCARG